MPFLSFLEAMSVLSPGSPFLFAWLLFPELVGRSAGSSLDAIREVWQSLPMASPEFLASTRMVREFETVLRSSETGIFALYYAALAALSCYALHRLHLLFLLPSRNTTSSHQDASDPSSSLPRVLPVDTVARVTVQLPLYNEVAVASRLIEAVVSMDYPKDRLQVQVLDDSTDETSSVIAERVAHWQRDGFDIQHLRRTVRSGYKAGALAAGLEHATGSLIAIFDADFLPQREFLRQTVEHFDDPEIGMVQARWDHLNRTDSILTRVQALLLDGHFLIEHAARCDSGRLFNFNGTAGLWRREAIEDGGGWQHDTLTEDLDLSYRCQLAGWKFRFLPEIGVPAELPETLAAYRGQQRRWTLGSAQTLRKLSGPLLRSRLSWAQKFEAFAHLSANLGYPLTVLLAFLLPLVVYLRHLGSEPTLLLLDLALLGSGTLAVCAFYMEAARRRGHGLVSAALLLPALLAVCMGLAWHNAKAALVGLFKVGGEFERTPKVGTQRAEAVPATSPLLPIPSYRARRRFPWGETLLAFYLGCATLVLVGHGAFIGLPFLLLFLAGFSSSAAVLWRRRKHAVGRGTAAEPAVAGGAET